MSNNKILIINNFANSTGVGITLSNIFSNWRIDSIHVVYEHISKESIQRANSCFDLSRNAVVSTNTYKQVRLSNEIAVITARNIKSRVVSAIFQPLKIYTPF